jgi:hypothetical protein
MTSDYQPDQDVLIPEEVLAEFERGRAKPASPQLTDSQAIALSFIDFVAVVIAVSILVAGYFCVDWLSR